MVYPTSSIQLDISECDDSGVAVGLFHLHFGHDVVFLVEIEVDT